MNERAQNLEVMGSANEEGENLKKPYEIDFRVFFKEILNPFTPPEIVIETIKELLPGDTQASDFEQIIEAEAENLARKQKEEKILGDINSPKKRQKQSFKSLFFMLVNSMGLANEVSNIRHAIGVLGIIQVRNAIMGMSLYQHFNPKLSLKFDKIAGGEIEKPIRYALYAEEFAKQNRCSSHLAFIAGLLFDLITNIIVQKEKEFKKIVKGPLKKPDEIIAAIWTHGLAVGAVANFINHKSKAKIPHSRFAFVAGLLHDIGKLALIAYNPQAYNDILLKYKETYEPYYFQEEANFNFSHETISALMLRKLDVFTQIELPIDHHHDHDLLAIRNPDMHKMAALIEISDAVVHNTKGFLGEEIQTDFENMPARRIVKLEKKYIQEVLDFVGTLKY